MCNVCTGPGDPCSPCPFFGACGKCPLTVIALLGTPPALARGQGRQAGILFSSCPSRSTGTPNGVLIPRTGRLAARAELSRGPAPGAPASRCRRQPRKSVRSSVAATRSWRGSFKPSLLCLRGRPLPFGGATSFRAGSPQSSTNAGPSAVGPERECNRASSPGFCAICRTFPVFSGRGSRYWTESPRTRSLCDPKMQGANTSSR